MGLEIQNKKDGTQASRLPPLRCMDKRDAYPTFRPAIPEDGLPTNDKKQRIGLPRIKNQSHRECDPTRRHREKELALLRKPHHSGQNSAILYSLIETCHTLGLNPAEYLRDLLEALPTMKQGEVTEWTPAKWNASRKVPPAPAKP